MIVSLFGTKVYSVIRSIIIQTLLALQTHRLNFSSSSAVVGVRCRQTHPFKEFRQAISLTATIRKFSSVRRKATANANLSSICGDVFSSFFYKTNTLLGVTAEFQIHVQIAWYANLYF